MSLSFIQILKVLSLVLTFPTFISLMCYFANLDLRVFNISYLEMWVFSFISFLVAFVLFYHANNLKIARGLQLSEIESVGLVLFKYSTIVFAILTVGFVAIFGEGYPLTY